MKCFHRELFCPSHPPIHQVFPFFICRLSYTHCHFYKEKIKNLRRGLDFFACIHYNNLALYTVLPRRCPFSIGAVTPRARIMKYGIWRSRVVGRARTIGNRVGIKRVSRVRIPPSPPWKRRLLRQSSFSVIFALRRMILLRSDIWTSSKWYSLREFWWRI